MGNNQPIQFPKNTWNKFKKQNSQDIYHNGKGLYAQRKQIIQDKKLQAKQQLKIYHTRSETNLPIVKVYNAILQEEKKNICSVMQKIIVFSQYIPNRLGNIMSFTLDQYQSLYVLKQALIGFRQLFNRFGYIEVTSDLIGFNSKGQVKCWINRNYASNRIENLNSSVLDSDEGNRSTNNVYNLDSKLKQSVQKGMVSQIWQLIKKKSNINSKELFYKLQNLCSLTFQKAINLIQHLVSKHLRQIPTFLYFQNNLQSKQLKFKQFQYGDVIDEQKSNTKIVRLFDKQYYSQKNRNNPYFLSTNEPSFRDYDQYRNYINDLYPSKLKQNQKIDISFEKKDLNSNKNFSESNNSIDDKKKNTAKNILKFDKTFDISLSSIPQQNSNKTIQVETQPSDKKIQSSQNIMLPLQTIQKTYSCFVPNATSQRFILNQIPSNKNVNSPAITSSRIVYQQIGPSFQVQDREYSNVNNFVSPPKYPALGRKITNSRYIPPPPIPGVMKRQPSLVGFLNQPNTPQFNRMGH